MDEASSLSQAGRPVVSVAWTKPATFAAFGSSDLGGMHHFLETIGEDFELQTGGYFLLRSGLDDRGRALLRCELEDERLDVSAALDDNTDVSAWDIAGKIVSYFDRRPREASATWIDLEPVTLVRLIAGEVGNGSV